MLNLENDTLLITPNKRKILINMDKLINIKIMTINEFKNNYYFNYNNETIYYLMNKYNLKYEVVKVYLDNLYYIKEIDNEKINKLKEIKQELIENKLLIKNDLFINSLKDKKIVVYGYDYIEKYIREDLGKLNVNYINNNKIYNNQELYEFKTKQDEIEFIATKIIDLISNNIPPNKIKIISSDEYKKEIEKIFKRYNININKKISLYNTNIIKLFLKHIKLPIEENLNIIRNQIDLTNEGNLEIYNKLINVLNNYAFINNKEKVLEMLVYDFKHINIIKDKKEQIEFITLENNIIDEDNYVFLLGFNIGYYPILKKDEDYLSDKIKRKLNLDTSYEINKQYRSILINKIRQTNNLIITYRTYETKEYYISLLNDELKIDVIKNTKIPYYNNLSNKIKLTNKLDLLNKYNEYDNDLELLYNNYKNIEYKTYDNKFTGIDKNNLNKYINNKLLLSYSSMDNYYKCGFKYYIENILKLNPYEEKFTTLIGSLFHYVLEKAFKANFDLNITYNEYIESLNRKLTKKEEIFLKKLKKELIFIIDTIKKQYENISLDKALYEEKIYVSKNTNITFMGIIDKLMYKEENDKTYVAIIDYKTGNPNLNLNNIIYGIDMQLPVYLYLSKNTNKLKNVEVIGFYLQKILNNEIIRDNKLSYEKQKQNNLKLQGYSINDYETLNKFDSTYLDSEIIKSLKVSKNGFYSYSKVLDKTTMDLIYNLVDKKITEAIDNIMNAKYDINPKQIGDKNVSCTFCKYKDICYKKEEDIIQLKEYKELEFLKE